MSVKHILAPVTGEEEGAHVPLGALHLAKRLSAHVTAGFTNVTTPLFTAPIDMAMAPGSYDVFYNALSEFRQEKRTRARTFFDTAVAATKLPIVSKPLCAQASTEWLDGDDLDGGPISAFGPLGDLVIVNLPGDRSGRADWVVVEDVLFAARRPALALPAGRAEVDFGRPVIAWNGSVEAANAVRCALDLFEPRSKIAVLQVGALRSGFLPAERLIDDLGWHCFTAELHQVEDSVRETGDIILREARLLGASVLVMGAYTHSRTREMILGGVTDYVLRHANIPLLLAH